MSKPVLFTAALLAAAAASAQTSAPPAAAPSMAPPPEFITAAQAFGECVKAGVTGLPVSIAPEAGAAQVLGACGTQRTALDTRFEAWVASPTFPDSGRAQAREQYKAQMATLNAQVADGIRQRRAMPAPAATPAPTPTATPGK